MLEYRVDDKALCAQRFIELAQQVRPGEYDVEKTRRALERTINITAWDGTKLVGCLRILTDGCFFGTIPEVLVLPRYQGQGIASALLRLAKRTTPTLLYFGAQPQAEKFYEKNGCTASLRAFEIRPEG